jgi:hypothetical protein
MSGPKVVRVVTREERIDTCESLLRQLDAAVASLMQVAKRFGDSKADDASQMAQRRSMLRELVASDRFDEAEQRIRQEIAYCQAEREQVVARATQAATSARAKASRQRIAAQMLIEKIAAHAQGEHKGVLDQLRGIAKAERHTEDADRVLAMAARLVTAVDDRGPQLSSDQQALANTLKGSEAAGDRDSTWRAPEIQDGRLVALQERLAQIEVLRDGDAAHKFSARLSQLEAEAETPARSMRIDALVLDVVSAVETLKVESDTLSKAEFALTELKALDSSDDGMGLQVRLAEALALRSIQQLPQLINAAESTINSARQRASASARRDAILSGLETLGYQVNETMATSWVEHGRVVLQKPGNALHGVELASAADAQRLQMRAVALSEVRPQGTDLHAETAWCEDFGTLKAVLAKNSSELVIERAMPVGAVPLKVVQAGNSQSSQTVEARHFRGRSA